MKYLALGGLVTVAMFSSINGHKVAGDLLKHVKYKLKQLKNNAHYLKKRGLIRGLLRKYLKTFDIDDMVLNRPEHWDGKWRLVIFDVPEEHKKARDALRRKLKIFILSGCKTAYG